MAASPRRLLRGLFGLVLLGIGLALGLTGCGRKGPLKPLRPTAPVTVEHVTGGLATVQMVQAEPERELT